MSEILRFVTLDSGGRPIVVLNLDDQANLYVARESFVIAPAGKTPIMSGATRRYGGSHQVGETTDNGTCSWKSLVRGASANGCLNTLEALLTRAEANPTPLLLEWRPDGATRSSYFEVRGTTQWVTDYEWAQFAGDRSLIVELSVPVAPLARGLPLDINDAFAVDTREDYVYDNGAASNEEAPTVGGLRAAANVGTENRAIHKARGYVYCDNQQTQMGTPGATITGWKNLVVLKRLSPTTYLEVYVEDNGTHTVLNIDKIIEGERTNLSTTNLGARVSNGTAHWLRGRIEGNVVTAEYFTAKPGPMTAPTTTENHTLTAGTERETFGAGVEGAPGRGWVPMTAGAHIGEYIIAPFTYRNQTLPKAIALGGTIPGDAPALADITVTPSGGAAAPIWALLAWLAGSSASGVAPIPFGIIPGEALTTNLEGWSVATIAGSVSTQILHAEAAEGTPYNAAAPFDPSLLPADAFTNEAAVEVWARVRVNTALISPVITLSAQPSAGAGFGSARYTDEWGQQGKLLSVPGWITGGPVYRFVRLGTLRMLSDPLRQEAWNINIAGSVGAGSFGPFDVDYLLLVPAQSRACSPSGKPNDAGYPPFVQTTAQTSKTIKTDLSARVSKPPSKGYPDHGLGGQLIELPPGNLTQLLAKLSSLVPDDPTLGSGNELTTHSATIHPAITPRWNLTRSS